jgi:hypothetical protein
MAFEAGYRYAAITKGNKCYGAADFIGKYGQSTSCNYPCKEGKGPCGGKQSSSVFRLDYSKDHLCSLNEKFDELDDYFNIVYGKGGTLTNPSGDGEIMLWTERGTNKTTILQTVRSHDGTVKGFVNVFDGSFVQYNGWSDELVFDFRTVFFRVNDFSKEP